MSSSVTSKSSKRTRKPLYPRGWGSGNVAYVGTFRAFSLAVLGRSSLEIGDKIILPSSALQSINRLRLPFPLIFEVRKYAKCVSSKSSTLSHNEVMNQYKRRIETIYRSTNPAKLDKIDKWLRNSKYAKNPHQLYTKICATYGIVPKAKITASRKKNKRKSKCKSLGKQYCSVYEFSSPQADSAYLPHWMMQNLGIDEGHKIELESKFGIRKGTFCKLQPFKQEFMDKVSTIGYKSTLEHSLRHYSVLSVNQRIVVEFNHFPYECIVKQTAPTDAISILGSTDLEIEFEEPIELTNNENQQQIMEAQEEEEEEKEDLISCDDESSSSFSIDGTTQIGSATQIDGILLKKLGVPLDYNEQTNLATMIIENRKLMRENESRFAIDEEDEEERDNEEKDMSETMIMNEENKASAAPGPNEIECNNCGKYIHAMSIQMHEVHCIRSYLRCDVCNECIGKGTKDEHWLAYHEERTCICNQICCGSIEYCAHQENECGLRLVECTLCATSKIQYNQMAQHDAVCTRRISVMCPLCATEIADSKDKLLHLLTECAERRAICNYCGTFRICADMEEHRAFCGSRSEKCDKCNQFVSLMNMEPHLQSNCQWFNNNQLSSKSSHPAAAKVPQVQQMDEDNPYIDDSLFGLLKSNPKPTLLDDSFAMDAIASSVANKQLCPHCDNDDCLMNEEEFHMHIAIKHPNALNQQITQTIMASFHDENSYQKNKTNKKKRRKLSNSNRKHKQKWTCHVCTFVNQRAKQTCCVCKAPKS
eukprot:266797_1